MHEGKCKILIIRLNLLIPINLSFEIANDLTLTTNF